ncbi:MAG: hypothetical protein ACD_2C00066G0001 [uncultured bacterium (gcode 4)]|uniref:Uncharacterized protein n=1 Tax=uncultured bacterium (gcode 4) TaxID=1234023 RepID=K2G6M1_9BACT|nr:MAG: hypothetical protein ACD_2C00066G0001 [uncultured bacterium (gcode 4)]
MTCPHRAQTEKDDEAREEFRNLLITYRQLIGENYRSSNAADTSEIIKEIMNRFIGITREVWNEYLLEVFNILGRPAYIKDNPERSLIMSTLYQKFTFELVDEIGMP